MKKSFYLLLALSTFGAKAECVAPSPVINYMPLNTSHELCFDKTIDLIGVGASSSIKVDINSEKPNSVLISPLESGVFTNMIVIFKDGERKEFNLLTLDKAKVETVVLLKD
ncbi:hypothetical protein [Moritella sp. F3]|uniref:hypothetical protein n=1 Tax=Moritella sp. F3 TaxID=2718882 RepID=UPI0018E13989|nr:hypothetical protein [Moritella sp. F3]GIC77130.1 hypothetical protein FMO001_18570 [Moritella sp. F1]GIC82249.1 hypothetical protein FMO003_25300 [Moritella sp. F3]